MALDYLDALDAIIGIDPGKGGAIALYRNNKTTVVGMPQDDKDLKDFFSYLVDITENPIVFIERVQMRPSDAHGGKQFGILKMIRQYDSIVHRIKDCRMPFIPVTGQSWQKKQGLHIKGEDYQKRKRRLKEAAQVLYPEQKVTLKNCDALLILRFARFILQNDRKWVEERFPLDFRLF